MASIAQALAALAVLLLAAAAPARAAGDSALFGAASNRKVFPGSASAEGEHRRSLQVVSYGTYAARPAAYGYGYPAVYASPYSPAPYGAYAYGAYAAAPRAAPVAGRRRLDESGGALPFIGSAHLLGGAPWHQVSAEVPRRILQARPGYAYAAGYGYAAAPYGYSYGYAAALAPAAARAAAPTGAYAAAPAGSYAYRG